MKDRDQTSKFLSGFVGIVGPPNVGKSTLLNRLLGKKLAIVSPKPQTTRNRITGVYHGNGYQMVFIDTPGIHKTKTPLHHSMVASAQAAFQEVDMMIMMVEMPRPDDPDIQLILRMLKNTGKPSFLVINKIDKGSKKKLLPIMDAYRKQHHFDAIIPVSALNGDGIEDLLREIKSKLKQGPVFFPPGMDTDQSETFLAAEIIREKVYLHTREELPYSTAVGVDHMREIPGKALVRISARIHVESDSQKAILIGHRGGMIKAIGKSARLEIERLFGIRVFLDLRVRVEKNWSKDPRALRRLGY